MLVFRGVPKRKTSCENNLPTILNKSIQISVHLQMLKLMRCFPVFRVLFWKISADRNILRDFRGENYHKNHSYKLVGANTHHGQQKPWISPNQKRYYFWWKKSCTTWDIQNLVNNGINYQPQLVQSFFPSTVVIHFSAFLSICIQPIQLDPFSKFLQSLGLPVVAPMAKHDILVASQRFSDWYGWIQKRITWTLNQRNLQSTSVRVPC